MRRRIFSLRSRGVTYQVKEDPTFLWLHIWHCTARLLRLSSHLRTAPLWIRADMLLTSPSQTSGSDSCGLRSAASPMQRKRRKESRSFWEQKSWTDSMRGIRPIWKVNSVHLYTSKKCQTAPLSVLISLLFVCFWMDSDQEDFLTESIRMCEPGGPLEPGCSLKMTSTKYRPPAFRHTGVSRIPPLDTNKQLK